ncbi:MOSC domain-containing protein [Micromonospora sp. NPDC049559]|uniref:MOSC domain-containing protein n=1 Tax=Micromonospora sp. NPDC049559 TaxID=3155923 RepID=UPI00341B4065
MTGELVSVNLGVVTEAAWAGDSSGRSGIDKRPAAGRVSLGPEGAAGDFIGERSAHGGVDKAVYAYGREDAAWWERELERELPPGAFGENLTTRGVELTGAVIGERWAVGSALLEVSTVRTPCATFAGYWGVPDLIKRFTRRGTPGAYLRVVGAGEVGAGDAIEVVHRPEHGVTIGDVFRALTGEPALLPRLLDAPELPGYVRARVQRRLAPPSTTSPAGAGAD